MRWAAWASGVSPPSAAFGRFMASALTLLYQKRPRFAGPIIGVLYSPVDSPCPSPLERGEAGGASCLVGALRSARGEPRCSVWGDAASYKKHPVPGQTPGRAVTSRVGVRGGCRSVEIGMTLQAQRRTGKPSMSKPLRVGWPTGQRALVCTACLRAG